MKIYDKPNNNWIQINYRHLTSLLGVQFILDLYDQFVPNINVHRYRNVILYYENGKMWSYTPEEDWLYIQYWLGKKFMELDPDFVDELKFYINRDKKSLSRLLNMIDAINLKSLQRDQLAKLLNEWYYTTLNDIFALNLAPVEQALTKTLKELLTKFIDKDEAENLIPILLTFEQYTEAAKEEIALMKLAVRLMEGNGKKDTLLREHMRKYSHLTLAYGSKEWSYEEFEARVNKLMKLDKQKIETRLAYMLKHPERTKESKEHIFKQLNNDHIRQLAELGAGIGYLRDKNKALLGKSVSYRNRIIDVIADKTGVSTAELNLYFLHEILELLLNDVKVSENELLDRESGIILSTRLKYIKGDEARRFWLRTIQRGRFNIKDLKGLCASPGEVKGKVRICRNPNECKSLVKGEILVAHGTDFDFIDAMMKAAAIITEEGGMLSHAAVVSREMQIPCIVGMKGVTSCLNNGDEIVVHASKGKITLISRPSTVVVQDWGSYFFSLRDSNLELDIVGGKAYNLSKILNQNILAPEGIVVGNKLFYRILEYNGLVEKFTDILKEYNAQKSEAVKELIFKLNFPEDINHFLQQFIEKFSDKTTFAVRSSGIDEDGLTESFAGIYHTSLFCRTTEEIIRAVKRCWCSFYGNWSMKYRKKRANTINEASFIGGVIIQEMIDADQAGVLFTANPVTGDTNELVIESCKGIANKLVDGSITPCTYRISKVESKIISQIKGDEFGHLDHHEISRLVSISRKLEKLYSYPLDVEWAFKDHLLYIIQVRPITTLQKMAYYD